MGDFNQELLTNHYSRAYVGPDFKHDSPELSRILMIKKISGLLDQGVNPSILNIGSGKQSLEKQLLNSYRQKSWINQLKTHTLDIAKISYKGLLAGKYGVLHVRANALKLPFPDNIFGMVVSNLAIDFLPHEAFQEAARVLLPEGYAVFNFHHPDLTENMSSIPGIKEFWTYLKQNQILFQDIESIKQKLLSYGISVESVELRTDKIDKWWEVLGRKK